MVSWADRHLDAHVSPPVETRADGQDDPVLGRRLASSGRYDEARLAHPVGLELLDHDLVEERAQLLAHLTEKGTPRWGEAAGTSVGVVRQAPPGMPPIDRRELAAIFAGGFLGAIARVGLVELLPRSGTDWPWATFIANVAGTFLLGYFATRLQERLPLSAYRRPLLGTGFCGALTTFSTVQVEVLRMLDANQLGLAAGYITASVIAGLGAMRIATGMVRRVRALA